MKLLPALRALFLRRRLDREMEAEMQAHLDALTQANITAGMVPEEAASAAQRRFGGRDQIRERALDARGSRWFEEIARDLRHAARGLRRNPVFAAVAIISLALAIGANTAVFSLVNGILLRSLPVPDPQELRVLQWSGARPKIPSSSGRFARAKTGRSVFGPEAMRTAASDSERTMADAFAYPICRALREQAAPLADVFAFVTIESVIARTASDPFTTPGMLVSDNFFSALGVQPAVGRGFRPDEDRAGAAPTIVITHAWWQSQFGGERGILDRTIVLNGTAFSVVGVLPADFRGIAQNESVPFYAPMGTQPLLESGRPIESTEHWWVHLMARVRPNVAAPTLQAALDAAFGALAAARMGEPRIEVSAGEGGFGYTRERQRTSLGILLCIVAAVALVACANLAGLSLARVATRRHEFAVRVAMGSGRWRLLRAGMTESLLLAVTGGALGVVLAVGGRAPLAHLVMGGANLAQFDLSLDGRVLAFALALTLATGVLSGWLPAWMAGRTDPLAGLKSRTGGTRLRAGRALVVAQVAISTVLLTGAGLYARTLVNLMRVDPGFPTDHLLLVHLNPRAVGYTAAAATPFYERVQAALAALPGVDAAALSHLKLLSGWSSTSSFDVPAHPELKQTPDKQPYCWRLTISPSFFETYRIPILLGRAFTAADAETAPRVVVINERLARESFPGEVPVGQTVRFSGKDWTIVGVAQDTKYSEIQQQPPVTMYFPIQQMPNGAVYLALRTRRDPLSLVPEVRRVVAKIDDRIPVSEVTTQDAVRERAFAHARAFSWLVGGLAGLAVGLAALGLFGLMAYSVVRRTQEIGVRMALGATPHRIARPILGEALLLAAVGLSAGLAAASALSRWISNQLYGVSTHDPLTLAGAALLLLAIAALASWLPARRASKVDPMIALRAE